MYSKVGSLEKEQSKREMKKGEMREREREREKRLVTDFPLCAIYTNLRFHIKKF